MKKQTSFLLIVSSTLVAPDLFGQTTVTPCNYPVVVDSQGNPLLPGGRLTEGCEGLFDRDAQGPYGLYQTYWDAGWGWDYNALQPPDYHGGYCRFLRGIRMLEASPLPSEPGGFLATRRQRVRDLVDSTSPTCSTSAGAMSTNAWKTDPARTFQLDLLAAFLGGPLGVAVLEEIEASLANDVTVSVGTIIDAHPASVAALMVHEATHYTGQPHVTNNCVLARQAGLSDGLGNPANPGLKCDALYGFGSAYTEQVDYLAEFARIEDPQGVSLGRPRSTPAERSEAVRAANYLLATAFAENPAFRLEDPLASTLASGVSVSVEKRFAGCGPESCVWTATSSMDPQVDSCGLISFAGGFTSLSDGIAISQVPPASITVQSAFLDQSVVPPDANYVFVPAGEMMCRSGGNPRFHSVVLAAPVGNSEPVNEREVSLGESTANRVCYLTKVAGDLNNGDYARVIYGSDGEWKVALFSNFSNGVGLDVAVGCQDGDAITMVPLQGTQTVTVPLGGYQLCHLTRVENDFAGQGERLSALDSILIGSASGASASVWRFDSTSGRSLDFGGDIRGEFVCFVPL